MNYTYRCFPVWRVAGRAFLGQAFLGWMATGVLVLTAASSQGQVVQLPSVRSFGSTGTVVVPDAGTGSLGGVRYGRSGSRSPSLGNHALGGSRGGNSLSVSVQIIDLKALDEAILSGHAQPGTTAGSIAAGSQRNYLGPLAPSQSSSAKKRRGYSSWQRTMAGPTSQAVVNSGAAESSIRTYLRLGQQAEQRGRINSSRVYYQLAVKAMTPQMVQRYHEVVAERKKAAADKHKELASSRQQF